MLVVGTNHKHSSIEFIEKLSFLKNSIDEAYHFFKKSSVIKGCVIVSTCNRVEFYITSSYLSIAEEILKSFIIDYFLIDITELQSKFYFYEGKQAVSHLFSVTSGVDSLVVGEKQIAGQVKSAFNQSINNNFADGELIKIFHRAFSVTKLIHSTTRLCEGKISVGSVAIDFIKQKLGTISGKNILIIGVGKVTELVLKYIKDESGNVIFIANRTFDKACALAEKIGAQALGFDRLDDVLPKTDIVITATSSPHFILRKDRLEQSISSDKGLFIIDLAVPRDIEPSVSQIKGVQLYDIGDLTEIINKNIEKRASELKKAISIIERQSEKLWVKFIKSEPARAS